MSLHTGARNVRLIVAILAFLLVLCQDGSDVLSLQGAQRRSTATPATRDSQWSTRGGNLLLQDSTDFLPASVIRVPQDYLSIQAAIDAAQDGDLVLVSLGTYTENLVLSNKTVTVASEFFTVQDLSLIDRTIIDGGGSTAITVDASVGPETKISGFTIQNGNDGISTAGELEILHNRFIKNGDAIDYEGGGGICRYNVFENNRDDAVDLDRATQEPFPSQLL